MIWIVVLLAVVAYLAVGFLFVAPQCVTRSVEGNIRDFPTLATDAGKIAEWRREAAGFALPVVLIWPFWLAGYWVMGQLAARAPLTTYEMRQQVRERDARIAELERQLGIH